MQPLSLKSKCWLGVITGLVVGASFRRLSIKYFSPWVPPSILLLISILILITGIIYPFVWHMREKNHMTDSYTVKAFLEQALIYAIAVDLSMFGWHKIEKLQMIVPLGMLDTPFSDFSGENLVWAFFRYSYPFILVIASLQIAGSFLLLFGRTRLMGILIIIPMLVFITLLDFFYQMPIGVFIHGLILLAGVMYLLLQDYQRIIELLAKPIIGLNKIPLPATLKNLMRGFVLILPVFFHYIYDYPDKHPALTGNYSVTHLRINQAAIRAKSTQDSVLTKVYLDLENEIVFDFNDYRRRFIGTYYLSRNDSISIQWRYPSTHLAGFQGRLLRQGNELILNGTMAGQRIDLKLLKAR